jgi:hypothetical protein
MKHERVKALVFLLIIMTAGCVCYKPGTGDEETVSTTTLAETGGTVRPVQTTTSTEPDRVCREARALCDQKSSASERAFCKRSLGC